MTSEPEAEQNLTEENGAALETRATQGGRRDMDAPGGGQRQTHGETDRRTDRQTQG